MIPTLSIHQLQRELALAIGAYPIYIRDDDGDEHPIRPGQIEMLRDRFVINLTGPDNDTK